MKHNKILKELSDIIESNRLADEIAFEKIDKYIRNIVLLEVEYIEKNVCILYIKLTPKNYLKVIHYKIVNLEIIITGC